MKNTAFQKWRSYVLLEIRKGMTLIPFFVAGIAAAFLALLLAAVITTAVMDRQGLLPRINVAVVTTKEGKDGIEKDASPGLMTSLAVGTVSQMDSVRTLADFQYVSGKEAEDGLADGSIDAAIYIHPDTYEDINTGVNTPVTVKLGREAASLSDSLFASLVSAGVRMLRTVEASVYTPYRLSGSYELTDTPEAVGDNIFNTYLHLALGRASLWSEESVSAFGGLTMTQFYTVSGFVLFLLVFGIGFTSFYTPSERQVQRLLARAGVPQAACIFGKILAIALIGFLFSLLLGAALSAGGVLSFPEPARALPGMLSAAFCLALLAASFVNLPGQWIRHGQSALFYALLAVLLFIVSGGLLPTSFLPEFLQGAVRFSPVHIAEELASLILIPGRSGMSASAPGIYTAALTETALFFILSCPGGLRHEH